MNMKYNYSTLLLLVSLLFALNASAQVNVDLIYVLIH